MSGVVYVQWYVKMSRPRIATSYAKHLEYIATRPGAIQNQGCGFGLWGKMGQDSAVGDINNLKAAMGQIRRISKEHTAYRAVISLDEDTALQKGLTGREEWQTLVTAHAEDIAKQNNIDLKDFRWCASYHQERGHPHAHIMFWDASDKVREEYMAEERFKIASEKIRAAFNGDIFKEELKQLRANQDAAQKELRTLSRNHVEGFSELSFFADESQQEQNADVQFYPRDLKPQDLDELCRRLEEATALLPKHGQLKYQYLEPNVKAAVDAVSQLVLKHTTLQEAKAKLIASVIDISQTYGNSAEATERQIKFAEQKILKDVGNDVLKAVKSLGGLQDAQAVISDEMYSAAHERMLGTADTVLQELMCNADFLDAYNKLLERMPAFLTPRHEVMQDAAFAEALRELTLQCMNAPRLRQEMKIGQAFADCYKSGADSDDANQNNGAEEVHQSEEFKAAYQHIHRTLYDMAANAKGWTAQAQFLQVNNFLRAFCRMTNPNNALQNGTNKFLLLRELSKQAQKERALKAKASSKMWDAQI